MVKYFCDKCNKELEEYEVFVVTVFSPEISSWNDDAKTGDCILCTKCVDEFRNGLLNPLRDVNGRYVR